MTPRPIGPRTRRGGCNSSTPKNKPAAGGAVTPSVAGNKFITARPVGLGLAAEGCYRRVPKFQGVGTVELVCYVAILGLICAAAWFGHHWLDQRDQANYQRGVTFEKERALEAQGRRDAASLDAVAEVDRRRVDAEQKALLWKDKWEADRRDANRRDAPLFVCPQPGPDRGAGAPARDVAGTGAAPGAGTNDLGSGGVGVPGAGLLTWQFVREYDSAWTGGDGQPVSPAPSGGEAAASAGAPSPHGLAELLDVHGENARRCSEDRRSLTELIQKLEAAAGAVDKENQGGTNGATSIR